ncbi:uncharacterized protein LOC110060070 isoform X2 [Orbicella faveolata]|uniref:uncharacterized protein LOC110060070 isoform X2 n=1 Tax=Orbicella faveolata TaxID=48498 RepID=UPI0009E6488A|nr:uncharacterized protein LOC110060070 isoform X2 [Orbicella faveolata]
MMKTLVLLTALVCLTITTARFLDETRSERECEEDYDCQSPENENLICNYQNQCRNISFWDEIIRRKPCFRIWKSSCSSDSDCPCEGNRLMCEDGECVENRSVVARS